MDFTEYMIGAIHQIVGEALRSSVLNPKQTAFLLKYSIAQKKSARIRRGLERQGIHVPPFMIASIASKCNLHCAGCYARANKSCSDRQLGQELNAERWDRIFKEASDLGVSFILLAGGEPLTRRDVLKKAVKYPNIIFPVFTNGTMFDRETLAFFGKHRNMIPVISIEGNREYTDQRRGEGIYDTLMAAMDELSKGMVFFGVSITATKTNLSVISGRAFVGHMRDRGCKIVFYIEYVAADGSVHLAPNEQDRTQLAASIESLRSEYGDMIFLSFPGDEENLGGCLASGKGFFHINPFGAAEPCPFSPFSDTNLSERTLLDALASPLFEKIRALDVLKDKHEGGCVLFTHEEKIRGIASGQAGGSGESS